MLFVFLIVATNVIGMAQVFVSRDAELSFYSKAPIEDIYAVSHTGMSALDVTSKTIYFKAAIKSFKFEKSLMREHFNENYMESDQYPYAEFKGQIVNDINLALDGTYQVTVTGDLTIHNVTQKYTVEGELKITNGNVKAHAVFPIKLVDHEVKIPRIVIKNIAEVVQVTVSADYRQDTESRQY